MGKAKAKKLEGAYRQLRKRARSALARVEVVALASAAVTAGAEAIVGGLAVEAAEAASIATLGAVAALTVILVVLEVKAWRAVVAACGSEPAGTDKVILAGALWFGGGLPLALVSAARVLGGAGDARSVLVQLGVSAAFVVLAALRFLPELRGR